MRFVFILGFCLTLGIGNAHAGLNGVEHAAFISVLVIEATLIALSARGVAYDKCEKPQCAPSERKICCIPDTVATDGHRVVGRCQEFQESVFNDHCGASLPVCVGASRWYCQSGTGPASIYSNSTSPTGTTSDSNIPGGYPSYQAALAGIIISPIAFVLTLIGYSSALAYSRG